MKARTHNKARMYRIAMSVFFILLLSYLFADVVQVGMLWFLAPLALLLVVQVAAEAFNIGRAHGATLNMALTAYDPCGTALATHTPAGACLEEGTGIFGMLLVKKGFNLATITDGTAYSDAKTAGNLKVIKDIEAFWPATNPVMQPGMAGRSERLAYINYEMPFKHEGIDANLVFWNTLNQDRNWGVAYITEDYKAYAPLDRELEPVLASFFAAPAGEQEFGKTAHFAGTVKWKSRDLVQLVTELTSAILKTDFQP
jgi:hypothetical protein